MPVPEDSFFLEPRTDRSIYRSVPGSKKNSVVKDLTRVNVRFNWYPTGTEGNHETSVYEKREKPSFGYYLFGIVLFNLKIVP